MAGKVRQVLNKVGSKIASGVKKSVAKVKKVAKRNFNPTHSANLAGRNALKMSKKAGATVSMGVNSAKKAMKMAKIKTGAKIAGAGTGVAALVGAGSYTAIKNRQKSKSSKKK